MMNAGLEPKLNVAYFKYDFAKHGGVVGDIVVDGYGIPSGSIIKSGIIHVVTAVTSGGLSTVAIKALTSADILASTAKASLTANALLDTVPDNTAANAILTSANLTALTFTVGTAALTAGKIVVALEYVVTN